ncbi:MAG: DUF6452 family protein [Bacteroidota bacterium]
MKRLFPVLLLFTMIVQFSSCEKDDICVEGDTPLLVVGFYDIVDTTFKSVNNLRIRALDNDSILGLESAEEFGFSDRANSPDSIFLPLRIDAMTTQFEFILDSADDDQDATIDTGNIDTLTFDYLVNEQFVSRACGFVANFNDLDTTRQVFSTDWIKGINILDTTITNSNLIHVQIFH